MLTGSYSYCYSTLLCKQYKVHRTPTELQTMIRSHSGQISMHALHANCLQADYTFRLRSVTVASPKPSECESKSRLSMGNTKFQICDCRAEVLK